MKVNTLKRENWNFSQYDFKTTRERYTSTLLFMCQHRSQLMCELYKDIFAAIRRGLYNINTYDVDYDCILHNYTN